MPAKAPIYLKSTGGKNGSGNGKGGKRLRELLSTEMISLPLGDFRHMAHVGRGGADDMFGDTTFLQEKTGKSNSSEVDGKEGAWSLGRNMAKNKKERISSAPEGLEGAEVKSLSTSSHDGYGPLESPTLKSAVSLPLLNQKMSLSTQSTPKRGGKGAKVKKAKKMMNNNCIAIGRSQSHEAGLDFVPLTGTANGDLHGPVTPRGASTREEPNGNGHIGNGALTKKQVSTQQTNSSPEIPGITQTMDTASLDDAWSFELDLGPSLMDDVMGVMDKVGL